MSRDFKKEIDEQVRKAAITLQMEEYKKLKKKGEKIRYAHCANCIKDMPEGSTPADYSKLEAIMDLEWGVLTVGCARCNMPIVCGMLPNDTVRHVEECECPFCKGYGS